MKLNIKRLIWRTQMFTKCLFICDDETIKFDNISMYSSEFYFLRHLMRSLCIIIIIDNIAPDYFMHESACQVAQL